MLFASRRSLNNNPDNRQGSALAVVVVAITVIAIAGISWAHFYYLPTVNQGAPASLGNPRLLNSSAPEVSTSAAPTAATKTAEDNSHQGWQTYRDTAVGFSILYPPNYKVASRSLFGGVVETDLYPGANSKTPLVSVAGHTQKIHTTAPELFNELVSSLKNLPKSYRASFATSTALVGDFSAQTIVSSGSTVGDNGIVYVFGNQTNVYQITTNYGAGNSTSTSSTLEASNKSLADKILATFQLLPQTAAQNPTSWQIYSDAQHGIAFPYPPGYIVQSTVAIADTVTLSVRSIADASNILGGRLIQISTFSASETSVESKVAEYLRALNSVDLIIISTATVPGHPGEVISTLGSGNTIVTSSATVAGYPAEVISISNQNANGAIYVFTAGNYVYSIKAEYDDVPSGLNSSSTEAVNKTKADRVIAGLKIGAN